VLAVAAMLLLAACGAGGPASAGSTSAASVAQPPESVAPPSEPSESQAASGCAGPELCNGPLAPGEFDAFVGEAAMTFTVPDEGWEGSQYGDTGFDLVRQDGSTLWVLSAAPYFGVVYSDVCSGAETEEIGTTAADFIGFVAERPGVTPRAEATEVTVGDLSGLQADVDVTDPGCESDPPERLWLWDLVDTDFHLNVGEAARLIALDGDEGVIVFIIEDFDPATFDDLLEATQPVIDSMNFRSGG
jgi:hypothetical protein